MSVSKETYRDLAVDFEKLREELRAANEQSAEWEQKFYEMQDSFTAVAESLLEADNKITELEYANYAASEALIKLQVKADSYKEIAQRLAALL